ncbi:meiosis-specific with OB domain-containing protein [Sitophilus oryzae]|uniref:Meiosis-specific with OB domain-containing protein n=1 Tax=Sitophilus oryzae TaxID=7048 RepID=A0A6J2XNM3_SITOR|nr:meiosis-specific with OB domain-containing protein [Sitophilus oryzae]
MSTENNGATLVTLERVILKNLDPNLSNILIVGIIIAKQRPRIIEAQENQQGASRAVWNFTFRDSLKHYINATYWGSAEHILQESEKYHTGDVVEVINPQVMVRKLDDRSEYFHPMVTSPYKLSLSDRSYLSIHPNPEAYIGLLRYPTKPTTVFVPFQNIHNNGSGLNYVDILGAVRNLGQIRMINSKNGEPIQVRQIDLFDHTCSSLKVTLWEPDMINRSNNWKPRSSILFFTDVKIEWSSFLQAYVAKTTGRTILTENPISKDGESLFEYAQTAPIETFDIVAQLIASVPTSTLNDDILSVKQLQDRINSLLDSKLSGNKSFTATVLAFVSHLDLDGLSQTLLIKCGYCKTTIDTTRCANPSCPKDEHVPPEVTFDIQVMLTDHTGTLTNCRLTGHSAEIALCCTATEFSSMSDDQKCALKWKYLLERCKVRLAVVFMMAPRPVISIVQIQSAALDDVARTLPLC